MKPENVNPKNFKVHSVLYNNNSFSIAYGKWEEGENCLAMRWDGDENGDVGYPKTFGYPVWFIIHDDLKMNILQSLLTLSNVDKEKLFNVLQDAL